jgi:diphosphomevalonate decarboxylase
MVAERRHAVRATAVAHPNVALIKYWGKRDVERNIPATGSISITLDTFSTTTQVTFDAALAEDQFVLNGKPAPGRLARVSSCLDLLRTRSPNAPHALVRSDNNFPTAAGLASSASGFAALVVAANHALDAGLDRGALAEAARRCSGSAARSLHGGFVELALGQGDDLGTTFTRTLLEPEGWPLRIAIAITATEEKAIGSSGGMQHTAHSSPYYPAWVAASGSDLAEARRAIEQRDFAALAEISEHSCLKMHGAMLGSRPGLLYWNGATVDCIHQVRELRRRGLGVFFTIDAGAQVKAVCLPEAVVTAVAALREVPGVQSVSEVGLGPGARVVEERG